MVDSKTGERLPVRAIVQTADGAFADGSGRNVYDGGRFFADGSFTAEVAPGKTRVHLSHGPEYLPLEFEVECARETETKLRAPESPASSSVQARPYCTAEVPAQP